MFNIRAKILAKENGQDLLPLKSHRRERDTFAGIQTGPVASRALAGAQ
jgi:hypothetical protein